MNTAAMLRLHRSARLIQESSLLRHAAVRAPSDDAGLLTDHEMSHLTGHDFSRVPVRAARLEAAQAELVQTCPLAPRRCPFGGACHTCPARVQAKLAVNEPGDQYEQEADRIANLVMRMPEPRVQRQAEPEEEEEETIQAKPLAGQITALVQRQAKPEEEEEEGEPVQAQAAPGRTPAVTPALQAQIDALRGGGQPLSTPVRAFFEPRFCDFSQVRVHTDVQAAESTRAVNALAYTVGQDVVFQPGRYAPETGEGRRLLAHELTHTIQQTAAEDRAQRSSDVIQRQEAGGKQSPSSMPAAKSVGELLHVNKVRKFFKAGGTASVEDVDSGKSYRVKARSVDAGGHADVFPLTKADTQVLRAIYGFSGEFIAGCPGSSGRLWSPRRAILVTVDADPAKGRKIAASQHGCPHRQGADGFDFKDGKTLKDHSEENEYPGHFCIHFLHSIVHQTGEEDVQHQQMVRKAAGLTPASRKKKGR